VKIEEGNVGDVLRRAVGRAEAEELAYMLPGDESFDHERG